MGWFDTVLGITNVALGAANYGKLQELKNQGAAAEMIQAILAEMKNEVFRFKQSAEEIILNEPASPIVASGMMLLLNDKIDQSPISPEIFPDLNDKDYVASTFRFIRTNCQRLINQLSFSQKLEVEEFVKNAKDLAAYEYYIDNFHNVNKYESALATYTKLKGRNSNSGGLGLGCGLSVVLILLFGFLFSLGIENFGLLFFLFFIVAIASTLGLRSWQSRGQFKEAKEIIDSLKHQVNLEKFSQIEKSKNLDRDIDEAIRLSGIKKTKVNKFLSGQNTNFDSEDSFTEEKESNYKEDVNQQFTSSRSNSNSLENENPQNLLFEHEHSESDVTDVDFTNVDYSEMANSDLSINASKQIKNCIICHAEIPVGAIFCPGCGNKQQE